MQTLSARIAVLSKVSDTRTLIRVAFCRSAGPTNRSTAYLWCLFVISLEVVPTSNTPLYLS